MANNYFSFKQFTIQQERCAMKVCTDACLLGAYTAQKFSHSTTELKNILDIGTGTGLLSLMLAQKTTAAIDAIEINKDAALQATENFQSSNWASRLQVINTSIQEFNPPKKYELIISNPPFFESDLKSADEHKNSAKHDSTLSLQELIHHIKNLLQEQGSAAVLIPYHRTDYFKDLINHAGLHIQEMVLVQQSPKHPYFRTIFLFSKKKSSFVESTILIQDEQRQYSPVFTTLLQDYYLKL